MNLSDSWTPGQQPIERRSAAEAVFHALRLAIEAQEIPLGSKLGSEAALAADYQVSRSVIREALRSCAALGLTRTETGRGTFVVSHRPTRELKLGSFSSDDLLEARPHIEAPAAALAATRRTTEDLERLSGLIEQMNQEDDAVAWVELDAAFHAAIARASGNSVFTKVVADIREAMARQSETVNLVDGRLGPNKEEHLAIFKAIEAQDPQAASEAMNNHLTAVQHAVSRIVRSH
ncbi:FadR/GntR family transcriptional regulator [Glutamicibacter sp. JC586]|uniref:FadR/GntR family transcriptional regulator n=1 Tax=Glutamicibacter sp. JC586 TaxID=2590552 RepID=UPI00135A2035|nr:FCD domain-containing protein [Glutamicibacter sp. JC586]